MARRWKNQIAAAVLMLTASVHASTSGDGDSVIAAEEGIFKPFEMEGMELDIPFMEQFVSEESVFARWKVSEATKQVHAANGEKDVVEETAQFDGKWAIEAPQKRETAIPGDLGLVVKSTAKHHAMSTKFTTPIDATDKTLIIQYEVMFQEGMECGGAYMKLLSDTGEAFVASQFSDSAPYTIMFGPDKCGTTNKVHFIFRHQSPVTGEYREHHMTKPPAALINGNANVYRLTVRPDNSFDVQVNGEVVREGSLLIDFEPPVNPPAEMDDPQDVKPETWIDEAMIVDASAEKPEDWDETAPERIPDSEATQPDDWLTDAPAYIPDPDAMSPADWDEEEDGDWEAPLIENPACAEASGCGIWQRPMLPNPAYKGPWSAPMMSNPAYAGVWRPRKIANPEAFVDLHPHNFEPMVAIGFEIWTMTAGILFDNLLLTFTPSHATSFTALTHRLKASLEASVAAAAAAAATAPAQEPWYQAHVQRLTAFGRNVMSSGWQAVRQEPATAGWVAMLLLAPLVVGMALVTWATTEDVGLVVAEKEAKEGKPEVNEDEDDDSGVAETDEGEVEVEEEEEEEEEAVAVSDVTNNLKKRRPRKE